MEQLTALLREKTGIDEATAKKVVDFIQQHMADIPQMLAGNGGGDMMGGLMDAAKGMFGDKPE
ncbi:MAG: hypothetical protein JNM28_08060 [Armatimonadetes bacterium]|nr:hypothetical protein [Armatimonadota bacterium]MBS1712192.1 hypothetical protein [Armatimonadota bacterium]MBX3107899.1 hypothetical protein [Fimbriimonadaceae bacterium]